MIPKIIHYCWFGKSSLPPLAMRCIESWKKYFPDYEIKEWNESNFNVNMIPYTSEAYSVKKYAFVSDYARFYILYKYGGLYFDTDVEIIKPMDEIINQGPFMGCENDGGATAIAVAPGLGLGVNPGLGLGVNPGLGLYKEMIDKYSGIHFIDSNGEWNTTTVVSYTTELLLSKGLQNKKGIQHIVGINIYPQEYFNPKNFYTGHIKITDNTYSIHHFAMSWIPARKKYISEFKRLLMRKFGTETIDSLIRIFKKEK